MPQCPPGSELVLLSASVAIGLSNDLSASDTSVLAGIFTAIGDNLALIAFKKQFCEENEANQANETNGNYSSK